MARPSLALLAAIALAPALPRADLAAQAVPPIRPLGPVVRVSAPDLLGSVSTVRPLPGGRVLVNDLMRRRVILLDSTLTSVTVIADSTNTSAIGPGLRLLGLIPYRGDSTLLVDPATLSMQVVDPAGKLTRTIAVPRPQDVMYLIGGPFGTPAFDARGRLIHRVGTRRIEPGTPSATGATTMSISEPDSAPIVRVDLATRTLDTITTFRVTRTDTRVTRSETGATTISTTLNPMQVLDDWAVLADGSIAIVRGKDYHVDWVGSDGTRRSTAKLPFDWQRLTDDDKAAVLDSARAEIDKQLAAAMKTLTGGSGTSNAPSGGDAKTPPRGPAPATPNGIPVPSVELAPASELPDYRPAFAAGAARGDAEGNLWIRTSAVANGGPLYHVVNREGELIDRVQLPRGRVIAGFAPRGIVYMGVLDGTSARLEEARVR